MNCPIGELRATVFSAPIIFDTKNVQRIKELLNPSDEYRAIPLNQIQHHPSQEPVVLEWEMVSDKNRSKLHFGPQKIDIIKSTFNAGEHSEDDFCKESCELFFSIIDRFMLSVTRIAYAPVYTPDWNADVKRDSFNQAVYNKNEFQGHPLSNILFKQAYIVPISLKGKKFDFNYVAEASEGQSIVHDIKKNSLTITSMLNMSLDINSRQGVGYVFVKEEMKEFFNNAAEYGKQFLEYYLG